MTDTPIPNPPDWAPPPPPAPTPAPTKKRKWPWVVGGLLVLGVIGSAGNKLKDPAKDAVRPSTITEVSNTPTTHAKPPAPTQPALSDLQVWVLTYGDEASSVMDEMYSRANTIAAQAGAGDVVTVMSTCMDSDLYILGILTDPVSTDGAPALWVEGLNDWERSFSLCAQGEFEAATSWTSKGTDAITRLGDQMAAESNG